MVDSPDVCELGISAGSAIFRVSGSRLNRFFSRQFNRLLALRSRDGPYRFLLSSWEGIEDVTLATRILNAECFRKRLAPLRLRIEDLKRILVLAPHPDDETIGAGGSLLLASRAGARIHVFYLTDGAQMNGIASPEDIVRIRRAEAEKVCAHMGASIDCLNISNIQPEPTVEHLQRLADLICEYRPSAIMAPWLLDTPAKHRLVYHLLWLANKLRPLPDTEFWGCQVHNTILPNGYVDITAVHEEKRMLLRCFESQNRYRHYDHIAMGIAAANSRLLGRVESPRYLETFLALPLDEVLRLVDKFYFRDLEATYLEQPNLIPAIERLHGEVMGSRKHGVARSAGND